MGDNETLQEHWEREALTDPRYIAGRWGLNGFEDAKETTAAIVDLITPLLPRQRSSADHKRVLEIGCGPGRLLTPLAEQNPTIEFFGIDVSKTMIGYANTARKRLKRENVYLYHTSTLDIFRDEDDPEWEIKFDLIYAVEVFQHLTDDQAFGYFEEAWSALSRGGGMLVQYVDNDRAAEPYSYPRTLEEMQRWAGARWVVSYSAFTRIHPEWRWMMLRKP